ncbi:hypothetical protein ACHAXR_009777 [Thalassiosira sp. AJA248-18]
MRYSLSSPSSSSSSLDGMANAAMAANNAARHHRKKVYGNKRTREKSHISMHRNDMLDSFRGRDDDSSGYFETTRSIAGGICSSPSTSRSKTSRTSSPAAAAAAASLRPLNQFGTPANGSSFEMTSRGGTTIGGLGLTSNSSLSSPAVSLRPDTNNRRPTVVMTPAKRGYKTNYSWPESQNKKLLASSSSLINYQPRRFQNNYEDDYVYNYEDDEDAENTSPNTEHFYDAQHEAVSRSPSLLSDQSDAENKMPCTKEVSMRRMFQPDCTHRSTADSICRMQSGTTGLCNLGNTCFMNAVIQCIAHTPSLADFFLNRDYLPVLSSVEKVGRNVANVIEKIYENTDDRYSYYSQMNSSYSPGDFLDRFTEDDVAPQFAGLRQHDSHEFLRVLIDLLCEDLKDTGSCQDNRIREATEAELEIMTLSSKADYWWRRHLAQNSSFITDEFCGQLISTIQCTVCKTNRYCFDPFYDVSLPFPEGRQSSTRKSGRRTSSVFGAMLGGNSDLSRCTLDDCLREFCKDEVLDGDDMTLCSKCRVKRPSIKALQVYRFPRVLVLHLKRFDNSRKKVRTSVNFPVTSFDASPLAYAGGDGLLHHANSDGTPMYDLYAVVNHSGRLNFGHYTSSCIDPMTQTWYEFNDETVSGIDESIFDGSGAYMLFYRLKES